MTTAQYQVNQSTTSQQQAQAIWEQLDAEEQGRAPAAGEESQQQQPNEREGQDAARVDESNGQSGEQPDTTQTQQAADQSTNPDELSGLRLQLQQAMQRLRVAEGHIGTLNSQLRQQQEMAEKVTSAGGDAPTAAQISAAQGSEDAMEQLKKDYPEFGAALDRALEQRLKGLAPQQAAEPGVTTETIEALRREITVEVQHPGWKTTVQSPAFQGWLDRQPRERQMLAASESPQDAIRLLDLYRDESKAQGDRTRRLSSAAALPTGRSGAGPRVKPVEEMTPQEYWRHLDQLEQQQKG